MRYEILGEIIKIIPLEEDNSSIDSLRNNRGNDRAVDRGAKTILTLQLLRDTLATTTTTSRKKLLRLSGCIKNAIKRIMYCN